VRAIGDVGEKLVGQPKVRDLLGNVGALALDERDPVTALTLAELFDLSQGKPGLLAYLDHPRLTNRLVVIGTVP
jgi:hypothetical protein